MSNGKQSGIMKFLLPDTTIRLVYRDLVLNSILFVLGASLWVYWDWVGSKVLTLFLAPLIISAPVQLKIWLFGGSPFKFWQDYEVATVDAQTGRVLRTDGGLENMWLKFFVAVIMIYVGVAIQAIKLIYLPIKYITTHGKESNKPSFLKSGFPIIIATLPLVIICTGFIAPQAGRITNDKTAEKYHNAIQKGGAKAVRSTGIDIPSAEIRTTLEESKRLCVSSHLEYNLYYGMVIHNGPEGTTKIDIQQRKKPPSNYLAGVYHFKNGAFDRFEDTYNTKRTPTGAQIETVKAYTPHALFDYFLNVKDSDLIAVRGLTLSGDTIIIRRDVDWKKTIRLDLIDDSTGKWFDFEDNNFPDTRWHAGLRGVSYRLRPKAIASRTATGESPFPFLANVTDTIMLMSADSYRNAAFSLEKGSELTVLNEGSGFFTIEYCNAQYRVWGDDMSKINTIGTISNPGNLPAEFDREFPFDAIVTEDIGYNIRGNFGTVYSISAGETVTVTGRIFYDKLSVATVTYSGSNEFFVYWKYLKLAD